jgi:glycosyltransferase involved in cell wall biosynthesis
MSDVRLYGRVMGHGSHAQVTAGFEVALRESGLLDGVVGLDVLGLNDHDSDPWAKSGCDGALAKHGVFTGQLEMLEQLVRAKHERRWAMAAPNSNWIPPRLVEGLHAATTDVLVPSDWARDMLAPYLPNKRIHVVPHGVHAGFDRDLDQHERTTSDYNDGQFRVLHCSTSERGRKGTWELLKAWRSLMEHHELPPRAELVLVLDYSAQLRLAERMLDSDLRPPNVQVLMRFDAAPTAMADIMRRVHVVCQPSRGEAFGMVGLESLACGTPIVATNVTGHTQYMSELDAGVVIVETGPDAPLDDGPGAVAPSLDPEEIRLRLREAYECWPALSAASFDAAPRVGVDWSWSRQLKPWLEQLR